MLTLVRLMWHTSIEYPPHRKSDADQEWDYTDCAHKSPKITLYRFIIRFALSIGLTVWLLLIEYKKLPVR